MVDMHNSECCICYVENEKLYQLCGTCIYKYCFSCIEKCVVLHNNKSCTICKEKINAVNEIFKLDAFLKIHEQLLSNEDISPKTTFFNRVYRRHTNFVNETTELVPNPFVSSWGAR